MAAQIRSDAQGVGRGSGGVVRDEDPAKSCAMSLVPAPVSRKRSHPATALVAARGAAKGPRCYRATATSLARVAELADALDLGSSGQPWGFESPLSQ